MTALNDLFKNSINLDIGEGGRVMIDRIVLFTQEGQNDLIMTYPAQEVADEKFDFSTFYEECKSRASDYISERKKDRDAFTFLPEPFQMIGTEVNKDYLGRFDEKIFSFFVPIIAEEDFLGVIGVDFRAS